MHFTRPWEAFTRPDGSVIWRPTLRVLLREADGLEPHHFLVDSGADLSLTSRDLCDSLSITWEDGERRILHGSPCVLPLAPACVGYLGGTAMVTAEGVVVSDRRATLIHAERLVLPRIRV